MNKYLQGGSVLIWARNACIIAVRVAFLHCFTPFN